MYPITKYLVLGFWVIVVTEQFLGKYMIVGYLDPEGIAPSAEV